MTAWERLMVFYGSSHRHPVNVAFHMFGVPVIVCAGFIPFAWLRWELGAVTVTGAWLVALAGLVYYFSLDRLFAACITPVIIALVAAADYLAGTLPMKEAGIYAAVGFFGGYALQFVGHAIEGRKPALFESLWKAMVTAPLFVVAEVFHKFGLRRELFDKVNAEIARREQGVAEAV